MMMQRVVAAGTGGHASLCCVVTKQCESAVLCGWLIVSVSCNPTYHGHTPTHALLAVHLPRQGRKEQRVGCVAFASLPCLPLRLALCPVCR
jgi:hypothetical protein